MQNESDPLIKIALDHIKLIFDLLTNVIAINLNAKTLGKNAKYS